MSNLHDVPLSGTLAPSRMKIQVIDALMSSGKTRWAIGEMERIYDEYVLRVLREEQNTGERFVYITPFLDEVERVKHDLGAKRGAVVYAPKPLAGSKLEALNQLLWQGKNIVSTHALFARANGDTVAALSGHRFTLVIDEVTEWVERYPISAVDLEMLYDKMLLSVDQVTRRVLWQDPTGGPYRGKFRALRELCLLGKIVASRLGNGERTILLWEFPVEILSGFERVLVMTHMFDGSDLAAYFKLHGVEVEKLTMDRAGVLPIPYDLAVEQERTARLPPLITVCEDATLNSIGAKVGRTNPLSVSWFRYDGQNGGEKVQQLANNLRTWFRWCGTKDGKEDAKARLWSTYKTYRKQIGGGKFTRSFLSCTARATNAYRNRTALGYLVNLYHHPHVRVWFQDAGVKVSEDFYALLTMTQWVFRSGLRRPDSEGGPLPVSIYIPSSRMRKLFQDWLAGKLPTGTEEREVDCSDESTAVEVEEADSMPTEAEEAEVEEAQFE